MSNEYTKGTKALKFLLYGATGYTGRLILELYFQKEGDKRQIVIAGRDSSRIAQIGQQYGIEYRIFDLKDPEIIEQNISDIHTLILAVRVSSSVI